MIDIGDTLREARRRRDLELADCELATRIRGRYLAALEDERFELLPEPAYARSFLRTYAAHLGLDPAPLVAELDERLGPGDAGEGPVVRHSLPRARGGPPGAGPRRGARAAWLGLGALAGVGLVIWIGAGTGSGPERLDVPEVTLTTTGDVAPPPARTVPRAPATAARRVVPPPATTGRGALVLRGLPPGGSWLQVRRGGPTGALVYEGTIAAGTARRFAVGRGLWLRLGWGGGLRARLGARAVPLPAATADVLVGPGGAVRVSPG